MAIDAKFKTRDFWLTAALIASKCGFPDFEWEGQICYFIFKSAKAEPNSEKYWDGSLKIFARDMTDALRTLKDRMHSNKL